ncbi:malic enzyme, NAD binding domain protein [Oesophagostomum dentatum]|uniref:Malic enzyme, NAD binding domain protein n=1 Tax=Oesophagostomum dentatum TaxID=61180 RepID=A0A0B1SDH4_OESDE|nr:malic enzyme, NAD binding domain protein [Oesophagostomum dentatum]
MSQTKIVFLGAGAAGLGIAELCVAQMMKEGISREAAEANIFLLNSKGLITKEKAVNLKPLAQRFAKDLPFTSSLLEVVKMVKPNALLGLSTISGAFSPEILKEMAKINPRLSTISGAFSPEILKEMAKINPRPIIFALSNPTIKAECTAEDAYHYTNGSVLFASGSPFDNVEMNGKLYKPGQGNNSYIFPGVALGAILFKARKIPQEAFLIAARVRSVTYIQE